MPVNYADAIVEWADGTTTLLELFKLKLGVDTSDRDEELSMYLDMAARACEQYIDNKLVAQEVTERFRQSRSPVGLRYWPAQDLTSVLIDGEEKVDSWEMISEDGITYSLNNRCGNSLSCCFEQMLIVYTAGYDPVPSDAAIAIIATALNYEQQTGASGQIKKEVVNGVGSIEYVTDSDSQGSVGAMSGAAIGALEPYRRWHV